MTYPVAGFSALAAQGAQGNPNGTSGVIVIVLVAIAVLVVGLALTWFFTRGRPRRRAMERHPAPPGSVGRVSELSDADTR